MTQTTPLREEWGERLRAARKDKGLTIVKLAQQADVDPSNLSRVERGVQGMSDAFRMAVSTALGKRVEELFPYPVPTSRTAR